MHAIEREFQPIGDAELIVDFPQVVLDHLLRGANFLSDILVFQSLGNTADDHHLLLAESELVLGRSPLFCLGRGMPQ